MAALQSPIDVSKADLCDQSVVELIEDWVEGCPASTPFHRPAWLLAVERATGQAAVMLVARSTEQEIIGLLPLTFINSRLFGKALVSSGFAVAGGILCTSSEVRDALGRALRELALSYDCSTAELRGGEVPSGDWQVRTDTHLNFLRALEPDDHQQLLAVPKRHRAELRKGLGNDLEFSIGRDVALRDVLYGLYARNVHRLGTPVFPKRLFNEVVERFGEDADIAIVSKNGEPLSAVLTLYHHLTAMPYWHGATESARQARSNEVLYFRLMAHARSRGMTHFDFGRSKVGTGPAAWKKSWGWEGMPLSYATLSVKGGPPRDINPLSPQYQRKIALWKKLPPRVADLIGPLLARGLG